MFETTDFIEIINNFQDKKILVIGDLMMDEYLWGKVSRLSPEAPVPVVDLKSESLRFGGASNVALNLKTLGCTPILLGMVGEDRMGEAFFTLMNENEMDSQGLIVSAKRPTTVKTRVIGDNQHLARIDREVTDYIIGKELQDARNKIKEFIPQCDSIILQDYNKGFLPAAIIQFALATAKKNDVMVTVDPKFTNFLEYTGCTIFKPNIKEASQALARVINSDEEIDRVGPELLEKLNAHGVLLTLGSKGMAVFEKDNEPLRIPTKTRKVADVSGAGDTVISTMTAAMTGGAEFVEAAYLANLAAGLVCEEVGIIPIEKESLQNTTRGNS